MSEHRIDESLVQQPQLGRSLLQRGWDVLAGMECRARGKTISISMLRPPVFVEAGNAMLRL